MALKKRPVENTEVLKKNHSRRKDMKYLFSGWRLYTARSNSSSCISLHKETYFGGKFQFLCITSVSFLPFLWKILNCYTMTESVNFFSAAFSSAINSRESQYTMASRRRNPQIKMKNIWQICGNIPSTISDLSDSSCSCPLHFCIFLAIIYLLKMNYMGNAPFRVYVLLEMKITTLKLKER